MLPSPCRVGHSRQVLGVRFLEESTLVFRFAFGVVILDCEEAVVKWFPDYPGIGVGMPAVRAMAAPAARWPCLVKRDSTCGTVSGTLWIVNFVEIATCRTDQNIPGVTPILGEKVAGKEVERPAAAFAVENLDPQKGLNRHVSVAIMRAGCSVESVDLVPERGNESVGGPCVCSQIKGLDLLADNPGRHWVDIYALHIASKAIGFDKWRAPAHNRDRRCGARENHLIEKRYHPDGRPRIPQASGRETRFPAGGRTTCGRR